MRFPQFPFLIYFLRVIVLRIHVFIEQKHMGNIRNLPRLGFVPVIPASDGE